MPWWAPAGRTPYGDAGGGEAGLWPGSQGGALVMSGLAAGHRHLLPLRGALRAGGVTAAVLGGGVDVIYPPGERSTCYEDVAATGVLLS